MTFESWISGIAIFLILAIIIAGIYYWPFKRVISNFFHFYIIVLIGLLILALFGLMSLSQWGMMALILSLASSVISNVFVRDYLGLDSNLKIKLKIYSWNTILYSVFVLLYISFIVVTPDRLGKLDIGRGLDQDTSITVSGDKLYNISLNNGNQNFEIQDILAVDDNNVIMFSNDRDLKERQYLVIRKQDLVVTGKTKTAGSATYTISSITRDGAGQIISVAFKKRVSLPVKILDAIIVASFRAGFIFLVGVVAFLAFLIMKQLFKKYLLAISSALCRGLGIAEDVVKIQGKWYVMKQYDVSENSYHIESFTIQGNLLRVRHSGKVLKIEKSDGKIFLENKDDNTKLEIEVENADKIKMGDATFVRYKEKKYPDNFKTVHYYGDSDSEIKVGTLELANSNASRYSIRKNILKETTSGTGAKYRLNYKTKKATDLKTKLEYDFEIDNKGNLIFNNKSYPLIKKRP